MVCRMRLCCSFARKNPSIKTKVLSWPFSEGHVETGKARGGIHVLTRGNAERERYRKVDTKVMAIFHHPLRLVYRKNDLNLWRWTTTVWGRYNHSTIPQSRPLSGTSILEEILQMYVEETLEGFAAEKVDPKLYSIQLWAALAFCWFWTIVSRKRKTWLRIVDLTYHDEAHGLPGHDPRALTPFLYNHCLQIPNQSTTER